MVVPKDVEVVVASFGGVGTTFLMDYISQYKKTNFSCDRDQIKHSPIPPISFNRNIRFVYVYGNPVLATISLFRRGYHQWQSEKLSKYNRNLNTLASRDISLEEYASLKTDQFNFRTHFYNWFEKYLVHPTMFIRYESIFNNIEPLVEFLDLPKSAVENFPKKKERKSSLDEVPLKTINELEELYSQFSHELESLNDVEIKISQRKEPLIKTYFSEPYPRVLLNNLLDIKSLARNNMFDTYKRVKNLKDSLVQNIEN